MFGLLSGEITALERRDTDPTVWYKRSKSVAILGAGRRHPPHLFPHAPGNISS